MAVDGIENVIRVLEEIENNKLRNLMFFLFAASLIVDFVACEGEE